MRKGEVLRCRRLGKLQPEKGQGGRDSLRSRPALLPAPGLEPARHSPVLPVLAQTVRNLADIFPGQARLPAWKSSLGVPKFKCIRNNLSSRSRNELALSGKLPTPLPRISPIVRSTVPEAACFVPPPPKPESARGITQALCDCAHPRTFIQEDRPGVLIVSEHNVKAKLK